VLDVPIASHVCVLPRQSVLGHCKQVFCAE